jgi:RimJ/RimL family protein N-acetyltransferase
VAFSLPTLPPSQPDWGAFQIWWQQVVQAITEQETRQDDLLDAIIAADAAAAAAQAAADTANAAATAADASASAAQDTADAITEGNAIAQSYVTGCTVTATDAGTDVTISISAHTRHYPQPDGTTVDVAVSAGRSLAAPMERPIISITATRARWRRRNLSVLHNRDCAAWRCACGRAFAGHRRAGPADAWRHDQAAGQRDHQRMIERTFDAAWFNGICNLPEVRPGLGGEGPIDVSPLLTNPANYALRASHGGFILVGHGAGFYSVHTQFAAEGRGAHALKAMRAGFDFMFTRTDCMRIYSHCPDSNPAALAFAKAGGARPWFRKENDALLGPGPGCFVGYFRLGGQRTRA